jgi:hypothetical protein
MTTITLPRATVEQVLEALRYFRDTAVCSADTDTANEVIPNLEAALAQQAALEDADDCPRIELVVAVHTLASHYENALGSFGDDDEGKRKAKGDITHAMKVAAKHNKARAAAEIGRSMK